MGVCGWVEQGLWSWGAGETAAQAPQGSIRQGALAMGVMAMVILAGMGYPGTASLAPNGAPQHDRALVTPYSPTPAQFPSLQSKMRVVLRVEVEAVKFLKEEPNRLDGLLKRCKTVTDTLAQIRR